MPSFADGLNSKGKKPRTKVFKTSVEEAKLAFLEALYPENFEIDPRDAARIAEQVRTPWLRSRTATAANGPGAGEAGAAGGAQGEAAEDD